MKLFQSATFKLTVWYLAILVTLSLIFSVAIYAIAFTELNNRLENLQRGLTGNDFIVITPDHARTDQYRLNQSRQASEQLISSLFYVNLIVFVGGGIGSYLLARRTLDPIQRSHEAMSRFTSDASHELRTPLAAMKTELEVALRDDSLSTEDAPKK
ncbi:hypothetical protein B7Y94_01300 [Candidatus Saccharibacteria bacterium 32-49-12]|nr:MAG: hypothetical protein B7Y94_01300 [Candidatus Saccharibacteria bacterium 32-49-12]